MTATLKRANSLLTDLNHLLSEFYAKYGAFTISEEWMERNEYRNAVTDDTAGPWIHE